MAQLLIRVGDDSHPDRGQDRFLLKDGDVVAVAEDDHVWGRREGPPTFRVVHVAGTRAENIGWLDEDLVTLREAYPITAFNIARLRRVYSRQDWYVGQPKRARKFRVNEADGGDRKPNSDLKSEGVTRLPPDRPNIENIRARERQ